MFVYSSQKSRNGGVRKNRRKKALQTQFQKKALPASRVPLDSNLGKRRAWNPKQLRLSPALSLPQDGSPSDSAGAPPEALWERKKAERRLPNRKGKT